MKKPGFVCFRQQYTHSIGECNFALLKDNVADIKISLIEIKDIWERYFQPEGKYSLGFMGLFAKSAYFLQLLDRSA